MAFTVHTTHPNEAHWASSERKIGCAGRKRGIKGKSQRQENSEHTIAIFKPSKESLAKNLISKVKPPAYGRFSPETWLLGSTPREGAHVSWLREIRRPRSIEISLSAIIATYLLQIPLDFHVNGDSGAPGHFLGVYLLS